MEKKDIAQTLSLKAIEENDTGSLIDIQHIDGVISGVTTLFSYGGMSIKELDEFILSIKQYIIGDKDLFFKIYEEWKTDNSEYIQTREKYISNLRTMKWQSTNKIKSGKNICKDKNGKWNWVQ